MSENRNIHKDTHRSSDKEGRQGKPTEVGRPSEQAPEC
jgi:hypothetical protein